MGTWTQFIITRLGATRVSEPEVKFIFFVLFFLGGLATTAKSEAVLPASLVGLVVAGVFLRDKTLVHRMRSIAFAIFTPFYFIKAGCFFTAGDLDRSCHHRCVSSAEDGDKGCGGISPRTHALDESARGKLYDSSYGYGPNVWNHLGSVWFAKPHH